MDESVNIDQQLQEFLQNNPLGVAMFDVGYGLLRVIQPLCKMMD
jgi:hypothetical protein